MNGEPTESHAMRNINRGNTIAFYYLICTNFPNNI